MLSGPRGFLGTYNDRLHRMEYEVRSVTGFFLQSTPDRVTEITNLITVNQVKEKCNKNGTRPGDIFLCK